MLEKNSEQLREEIETRVEADETHFGGTLPQTYVIAWSCYAFALFEWGALDVPDYKAIIARLPTFVGEDDPMRAIAMGRE